MPSEDTVVDWNEYQQWATEGLLETAMIPGHPLVYPALGLAGEAGEYVDKVKKTVRDGMKPEGYEDMALELGDVLWYLAVSAEHLGFDLSTIVEMNMAKLNRRREENLIQGSGDHR
jgi:NTP pyrophosphatase (non-canonical NTP hydrolase)